MATRVPFPVDVPYSVRPDLRRAEGPVFARDVRARHDAHAKLTRLAAEPQRVRVRDPDVSDATLTADLNATAAALAQARPELVHPVAKKAGEGDRAAVQVAGWAFPRLTRQSSRIIAQAPAVTRLADALALSLPEDLVWMRNDGAGGRAELLHVSYPSHWAPETRAGASLAELHGPVAEGARLRAASTALMNAMCSKGPFERFVWSLAPDGTRARHPAEVGGPGTGDPGRHAADADPLARWWFRVERQTTLPFPDRAFALFTIRILQAPLREVLAAQRGRAARLAASVRSMGPELLRYKGLANAREGLLDALDAFAEGSAGARDQGEAPPGDDSSSGPEPPSAPSSLPSSSSASSNEADTDPSTTTSFVSRS